MNKTELLNLVRDELELGTKKGAQEFLDNMDKVIEAIAEKLNTDDKVKVGKYLNIKKKHFESKVGKVGNREYSIDEHEEILVKRTASLKNILK